MKHCNSCSGDCASCSGCNGCGVLELTREEMEFLTLLGQIPFLPVARTVADPTPVCPDAGEDREIGSLVVQCLEKKGLVELDFERPLKNYTPPAGENYPIWGSVALTARGQRVLELIQVQGIQS